MEVFSQVTPAVNKSATDIFYNFLIAFDPSKVTMEGVFANSFKVLLFLFLIGFAFFALFLYLRVRILALTLSTRNTPILSILSFFFLVGVVGYVILMTLLLLL